MGVAHAPVAALLDCDSGVDSRPAAQSAAGWRREAADWQTDRASVIVPRAMRRLYSPKSLGCQPGNGAPESWFPHPVPL
jgi:hypothetical protein